MGVKWSCEGGFETTQRFYFIFQKCKFVRTLFYGGSLTCDDWLTLWSCVLGKKKKVFAPIFHMRIGCFCVFVCAWISVSFLSSTSVCSNAAGPCFSLCSIQPLFMTSRVLLSSLMFPVLNTERALCAFLKMCHMLTPRFWNYYSSFACCFDWKKSAWVCVWERVRLCVKPHLHVHVVAVFSQLLVLSVVWPRDGVCAKVNQPIVAGKEWCDICLFWNSLIKCHVKICYEVRPTIRLTESGNRLTSLAY